MSTAGAGIAGIVGYPVIAAIAANYGWEVVFYSTGSLGVIWFIPFVLLVFSNPDEHPRISQVI